MTRDGETKAYYDDFSGWYEKERHHGYHAMLDDLEIGVLEPLLPSARQALEVGAGTGLIMQGIASGVERLVGVDISAGMLQLAAGRGFQVVQGSATDLPFVGGTFDLAYSFKVLAHVPDIRGALAEMARVLRPGGHLVAEFYNRRSLRRLAKAAGRPGRISEKRDESEVYTRWDTEEDILGYLPQGIVLERWCGVRVFTPTAAAFRVPGLSRILPHIERRALTSPLARYGGFLVAVCRKAG